MGPGDSLRPSSPGPGLQIHLKGRGGVHHDGACGGRAGIFTSRGGEWLHYIGELDDYNVEPYDPGHPPVIGWRPAPGIVFVAR